MFESIGHVLNIQPDRTAVTLEVRICSRKFKALMFLYAAAVLFVLQPAEIFNLFLWLCFLLEPTRNIVSGFFLILFCITRCQSA